MGLRARLLGAFVLVAVPPLLLLTALVTALLSRSFDRAATARLSSARQAVEERIALMRRQAETQVADVARQELPGTPVAEGGDRRVAQAIALRRGFDALEIIDGEGRVVSSHHWPAGFGLPERDLTLPGDGAWRVETVAEGYGSGERLALMPSHPGLFRGKRVVVRGGPFVDAAFLGDLASLMDLDLAIRDVTRGLWIAPVSSPLRAWIPPGLSSGASGGEVVLGGTPYRWAAAPLQPALLLVIATPRAELDRLTAQVRRSTFAITFAALLAALAAGVVLSGRVARPVRDLAEGTRRVADGDLASRVEVASNDEIGQLARAFNTMTADLLASRERLLQSERVAAWREMARRLAHELKNPLFPIQLSIETLRRAFPPTRQEGQPDSTAPGSNFAIHFREATDTILQELASLRRVIEEFSEFARLPRPQLRPTDLNAVVERALRLHEARAAPCRIEKELAGELPRVSADPDLLARALSNLVANALEAMPDGGTLRLRTSSRPGTVVLEVEDTGPGLSDRERTRLFTPYYTTKKGGTGLGLAIVQGIVSDLGGRVEVRSAPGQGTAFTLVLPTA